VATDIAALIWQAVRSKGARAPFALIRGLKANGERDARVDPQNAGTPALALAARPAAGLSLQRSGRHADAERLYRTLAHSNPGHPDVCSSWGWLSKRKASRPKRKITCAGPLAITRHSPRLEQLGQSFADASAASPRPSFPTASCRAHDDYAEAWIGLGEALLA